MAARYPSQHRIMFVTPLPPTSDISAEHNAAAAPDWGTFAVNEATELPERPETEDLRRLLHYWNARRGERAFPRRRDIDPLDFWYMIDRVALTEVHDDPRRYRLRLVGGFWGRLAGLEATGMWLDDWPHPNQRKLTEDSYAKLVAGRVPRLARRDSVVDYQTLRYEIMLLPLSEDGNRVSMIMAGIGQN